MQANPTGLGGPDDPDGPTLEERVLRAEFDLVKVRARLEDVIDAQNRSARSLGALNTLLSDIASMDESRTSDER